MTGALGTFSIALFWLIVVIAEDQMEVISLQRWLDSEANQVELLYQTQGQSPEVSNSAEFVLYRSSSGVPRWLQGYQQPGFFEHQLGPEDKHFLVRPDPSGDGLMYVVFRKDADDYLDDYEETLHTVTLLLGVFISLLMYGYGWYLVRQISRPLQRVTDRIQQMGPDQPDFTLDAHYKELYQIESALLQAKQRNATYVQREQEFSRFAAHEIRTPLMVLQGSAELLQQLDNPTQNEAAIANKLVTKAASRIRDASEDITLLTDAFLLLGREQIEPQHFHNINLASLVQTHARHAEQLYDNHHHGLTIEITGSPTLTAPTSFVVIALRNLLKNAFAHGSGAVQLRLTDSILEVSNPTQSMTNNSESSHANPSTPSTPSNPASRANPVSPEKSAETGYGYGLVIVERIAQRLNWKLVQEHSHEHSQEHLGKQKTSRYIATLIFKHTIEIPPPGSSDES